MSRSFWQQLEDIIAAATEAGFLPSEEGVVSGFTPLIPPTAPGLTRIGAVEVFVDPWPFKTEAEYVAWRRELGEGGK